VSNQPQFLRTVVSQCDACWNKAVGQSAAKASSPGVAKASSQANQGQGAKASSQANQGQGTMAVAKAGPGRQASQGQARPATGLGASSSSSKAAAPTPGEPAQPDASQTCGQPAMVLDTPTGRKLVMEGMTSRFLRRHSSGGADDWVLIHAPNGQSMLVSPMANKSAWVADVLATPGPIWPAEVSALRHK